MKNKKEVLLETVIEALEAQIRLHCEMKDLLEDRIEVLDGDLDEAYERIEKLEIPLTINPLTFDPPILHTSGVSMRLCPSSSHNEPCDFMYAWSGITAQPCKRCNTTVNAGLVAPSYTSTITTNNAVMDSTTTLEAGDGIQVDNTGTVNLGEPIINKLI